VRPIILGIFAALFFASTFVLNRAMDLSGGSWIWSASLRYFFMIPFLLIIVIGKKNFRQLLMVMKENPRAWLLWSCVGFGLFYAPICFSASYAPGWLTAGTWQITIISGSLLAPLFYVTVQTEKGSIRQRGQIPVKGLLLSLIILLGVVLMQVEQANQISTKDFLLGVVPVIIASFAYPLGNRKMMDVCKGQLDTYQRVLGMTLASLPFWFILSGYGLVTEGLPTRDQTIQSGLVAICSGVIATVLFFHATDLVRGNMRKLASVEATQSIAVLFTLWGEIVFLGASIPSAIAWVGIGVLMSGMILHSYVSQMEKIGNKQKEIA
jgi:drug/metabolite transporter (DMT)-like permease